MKKMFTLNSTEGRNLNGFTLIELLVSVAVLAILTSFGYASFQNSLARARDATRRSDLKQLQIALESYHNDYGQYPRTDVGVVGNPCPAGSYPGSPNECGENASAGGHTNDYIPTLTPKYIRALPNDPRKGKASKNNQASCTDSVAGYVYQSNGTYYKLRANCTVELSPLNTSDTLLDPPRAAYNWAVYSDAAINW